MQVAHSLTSKAKISASQNMPIITILLLDNIDSILLNSQVKILLALPEENLRYLKYHQIINVN